MLFAPAEVFDGGVEFFFAGRNDGLMREGDEVFLAFDPGIQALADAPNAGAVFGIRTGGNQESIHRPMMVWAQGQPIVRSIISTYSEGDDVGGLDQEVFIVDFNADAASGAAVIVDFKDGVAKGAVPAWWFVVQSVFLRWCGVVAGDGSQSVPLLGKIPGDQGLAQLMAGVGVSQESVPETVVEAAVGCLEDLDAGCAGGIPWFVDGAVTGARGELPKAVAT